MVTAARRQMLAGEFRVAAERLLELERVKARMGLLNPAGFDHLSYAVIALCELGENARAAEISEWNLERTRRWGAAGALALAEAVAARLGPVEAALPLLQAALVRAQSSPRRLVEAEVAIELGRAQAVAGHPRLAADAFHQALDAATAAGGERLVAEARSHLSPLGKRARRRAKGAAALTPAELRVARLAAAGRSNRQIADQMFLTVSTVENHLRSVYRKLETDRSGLRVALGQAGEL